MRRDKKLKAVTQHGRYMELPYTLHLGDSREVLKTLPDNSVDSIVCDPPYGLSKEPDMAEVLRHWIAGDDYTATGAGFMGKSWDSFVPGPAVWRECLRVLKPGGHLLAFFGSRTYDLGTLAIRLAGFEIRDQIQWIFGSGFPKNLDVSKAIDKIAGVEREDPIGRHASATSSIAIAGNNRECATCGRQRGGQPGNCQCPKRSKPLTEAARKWEGWGTALKPAHEPICVARKPLIGTVAANVLAHGTGALNIDACRVDGASDLHGRDTPGSVPNGNGVTHGVMSRTPYEVPSGRWPANLILSYPEDQYELRDDVTPQQLRMLAEWIDANT